MHTKLRVGLVANTYDKKEGLLAGGHVHLIEVARRWNDFEITVFAPEPARRGFREALPDAGFIAMPSCDSLTQSRAVLFFYRTIASLTAWRSLKRCDVLLLESPFLPDVVPGLLFGPQSAIVSIAHLQDVPWRRSGSLFNNLLAYANERLGLLLLKLFFPTIVVFSKFVASQLQFGAGKNIYISGCGVSHASIDPSATEDGRSGAVCIARLHPTKALEDLIDAWRIVVDDIGPQTLRIIGDGDARYRSSLQERIESQGLAQYVTLLGRVSDEDKERALLEARVFAFPSKEEGWGIVIAEAMAAGMPCVTYDLEVYREIFPSGRVSVAVGDITSFARRIAFLLRSDDEWRKLSAEALSLASSFTWEHVAQTESDALTALPGATAFYSQERHMREGLEVSPERSQ
jgi:glycosyltransferase involved in cell wall biosynthesis